MTSDVAPAGLVTLEAAGPDPDGIDDELEALHDLLTRYGGAVSGRGGRYGATFSVEEPGLDAPSALALGYEIFRDHALDVGLPDWPIVRAEVMTFAEHDADRSAGVSP